MDIIKELNNSKILTNDVENAIDNFDHHKLYKFNKHYYKLIDNNTKRKKKLRKKHKCILESDIEFLKPIFNEIRKFFSKSTRNIKIENNDFINGGIYIDVLKSNAHKPTRLLIVNYRFNSDFYAGSQVKNYMEHIGLNPIIDYDVY